RHRLTKTAAPTRLPDPPPAPAFRSGAPPVSRVLPGEVLDPQQTHRDPAHGKQHAGETGRAQWLQAKV
ncbi:hypothetical protein, partial [Streptomyces sp. NPDC048551]|uniref:hypothetical protein n=1 Tax=Streptomyces sp. NPDC048551 TaxID=3155758 RepID=UPI003440C475